MPSVGAQYIAPLHRDQRLHLRCLRAFVFKTFAFQFIHVRLYLRPVLAMPSTK
jgi:hypothetical protein